MMLTELIFETTRRCNLDCEHCLRGDPQNKQMDIKTAETFIDNNNIHHIYHLFFSGGEPLLNIEFIKDFLELLKRKNISLGSFGMVTNGTICNIDIMKVLMDYHFYCDDPLDMSVEISNDEFHERATEGKPDMRKMLKVLRFVHERSKIAIDQYNLIAEGRGYNWPNTRPVCEPDDLVYYEDNNTVEGLVYINALGQIINGCDYSYETQEEEYICTINDKLLNFIDIEEQS